MVKEVEWLGHEYESGNPVAALYLDINLHYEFMVLLITLNYCAF